SVPKGPDDSAASAIRNLLQEHELSWDVTIRDAETGKYVAHKIRKPGPTTFLTTGVRPLADDQYATRVFSLEAPEDVKRVRAALRKQADLELHPPTAADPALVAHQEYLQALAPWDVTVPFAERP